MNNQINYIDLYTNRVFSNIPSLLRDLFKETIYPWEILPKINRYIIEIIPQLDYMGYKEYSDGVWIGKGTYVSDKAEIIGPAIIGCDCEIRPGAYIRENLIAGNNCVIGNSTEVKNSVIFDHVQIPHYNYVGDSILGNFSHMGAGAICSNQKQDKSIISVKLESKINTGLLKMGAILADKVEVGCGCVLNPGTVILTGTRVYPLNSVRGVIPPNSIMKTADSIEKINSSYENILNNTH